MWPWGHAAVGYLLYTVLTHVRDEQPPAGAPVVWLAVGTQFPDLVDKPLAWTVDVLPAGRTLAHTLFVAIPVCVLIYLVAHRRRRSEWAAAFGLGYLSHVVVDALPDLLRGELVYARFLLWPVVPAPPYEGSDSVVGHVASMELTGYFTLQLVLAGLAVIVWWRDGRPGIAYCLDHYREVRTTVH